MSTDQAAIAAIVAGLCGRAVRFINGIAAQDFVRACRWEDRARQKLRKAGLVIFNRADWRWELTETGLAVRDYLKELGDEQG